MNYELILVVLTAITGMLFLIDFMIWKPKRKDSSFETKLPALLDFAQSLFPVFLVVLILRSFILEPFRIPSESMYPTLEVYDFIVVNKFAYGVKLPVVQTKIIEYELPERGDVIVFKFPKDDKVDYIKRVIGLPGDKINYINRTVFVNGKPNSQRFIGKYKGRDSGTVMTGASEIEETNADGVSYRILLDHDRSSQNMDTLTVPEGHYFVMGDNRDHSNDSRFWGFVPEKNIRGHAFGIWLNLDHGWDVSRIGNGI